MAGLNAGTSAGDRLLTQLPSSTTSRSGHRPTVLLLPGSRSFFFAIPVRDPLGSFLAIQTFWLPLSCRPSLWSA
jgi:hypothetical protein